MRRDWAICTRAPDEEDIRVFKFISCNDGHKGQQLGEGGSEVDGENGTGEQLRLESNLSVIMTPLTVNLVRDGDAISRHCPRLFSVMGASSHKDLMVQDERLMSDRKLTGDHDPMAAAAPVLCHVAWSVCPSAWIRTCLNAGNTKESKIAVKP